LRSIDVLLPIWLQSRAGKLVFEQKINGTNAANFVAFFIVSSESIPRTQGQLSDEPLRPALSNIAENSNSTFTVGLHSLGHVSLETYSIQAQKGSTCRRWFDFRITA